MLPDPSPYKPVRLTKYKPMTPNKPEQEEVRHENWCDTQTVSCDCGAFTKIRKKAYKEPEQDTLAEVEKKLKSIAMVDNGKEPKYFVKDVLDLLTKLK